MSALGQTSLPTDLVPGSVERVRAIVDLSRARQAPAREAAEVLSRVTSVEDWAGEAADAYAERIAAIGRRWTVIGEGLADIGGLLSAYAQALGAAQASAEDAIAAWTYGERLPETEAGDTASAGFRTGWPFNPFDDRYGSSPPTVRSDAFSLAQAMLADARADVAAAGDAAAAAVVAATEKVRAKGEFWTSLGESLGVTSPSTADFLGLFGSLDPAALTALLRVRPDLLARLKTTNPEDIAPWWRGLSEDQREVFIIEDPYTIGNLGGVPYGVRDRANRVVLAQAIVDAKNSPLDMSEQVAALEALEKAAAGSTLAALVLDVPPLAQVAVGNLDAADYVSFIVPGMNTTVGNSIERYVEAAFSLRAEQSTLSGVSPERIAVMAWLGYHPPVSDPLVEAVHVFSNHHAQVGAGSLVHDLKALDAARQESKDSIELTVIGHSYGTDVTCLALEAVPADHVVLLGSAGISREVGSAGDLLVPPGQVFASQAVHDEWAPIGQLSGRADPTGTAFGARTFTAESAEVNGERLEGVSGHGPFGSDANKSYLDGNTTARRYSAMIAMGQGFEVPIGGGQSSRIISQWTYGPEYIGVPATEPLPHPGQKG